MPTKTLKTNSNINPTNGQVCSNKRQALSQLKRKKWNVQFKTKAQEKFYNDMEKEVITFCTGPAGTGKTYISVYFALKQLADKESPIDGIILCRPLIPIDNQGIGYLPGSVDEKVDPYMLPYWQTIEKLIGKQHAKTLIDSDTIKVIPLAFFRGLSIDNKIILFDEAQNSTATAMKSVLTRIGDSSKMIVMGDMGQTDRKGVTGLEDAIGRLRRMKDIGITEFRKKDIVRHSLITRILTKYEKNGVSDENKKLDNN